MSPYKNFFKKQQQPKHELRLILTVTSSEQVLRENLSVQDLGLQDYAQPVKMAHVQLGDKLM